jgi:hypothetical protein
MTMIDLRIQVALAFALAVSAFGVAHAAAAPSGNVNAHFNQCSILPLSQRPICRMEAVTRSEAAGTGQLATGESEARAGAEARYQAAVDDCNRRPLSQRGICKEQALSLRVTGGELRDTLAPSQRAALDRESTRFQAAVADCNKLPLSQRAMCRSEAGTHERLQAQG